MMDLHFLYLVHNYYANFDMSENYYFNLFNLNQARSRRSPNYPNASLKRAPPLRGGRWWERAASSNEVGRLCLAPAGVFSSGVACGKPKRS